MISGIWLCFASITAGYKLATAVPDVVMITTGFDEAWLKPNARNPKPRSSK